MRIGAFIVGTALLALLAIVFQSSDRPERPSGSEREITVFAAASLADVMERLATDFERTSGVRVRLDFSSSGVLRMKIVAGARADVFLSASARDMDRIEGAGCLAPGTRRNFLRNGLVIVVPLDSTLEIAGPADLMREDVRRIAIGDPGYVPAGEYAREALLSLNLWGRLARKLVPCANARATLAQAESGAVDAAVVYSSDAGVSRRVKVAFTFPTASHAPIIYPGCVLKQSPNPKAAVAFLDFVVSDSAADLFVEYGFQPIAGSQGIYRAGVSEEPG